MHKIAAVLRISVLALAIGGAMVTGLTPAGAATGEAATAPTLAGPHAIGVAQWSYYGTNLTACNGAENFYRDVYSAHIIQSCTDTTPWLQELAGVDPNFGFEYQLT